MLLENGEYDTNIETPNYHGNLLEVFVKQLEMFVIYGILYIV